MTVRKIKSLTEPTARRNFATALSCLLSLGYAGCTEEPADKTLEFTLSTRPGCQESGYLGSPVMVFKRTGVRLEVEVTAVLECDAHLFPSATLESGTLTLAFEPRPERRNAGCSSHSRGKSCRGRGPLTTRWSESVDVRCQTAP